MGRFALRLEEVVDFPAPVGGAHQGLFVANLSAHLFLLGDDFEVLFKILGANRRGPLEHHVLEQVRDAGDARPFVGAADVRDPAAGDGRVVVPLDHQDPEAVGQRTLQDLDLLSGNIVGLKEERQRQRKAGRTATKQTELESHHGR